MDKNRIGILLGVILTAASAFAPYQLIAGKYYSMFQHGVWLFVVIPAAAVGLLTLLRKNGVVLALSIIVGIIQGVLLYITIHDWPSYLRSGKTVGLGWGAWAAIAGALLMIGGSIAFQYNDWKGGNT